jgi:cytochrome c biogenesis protein
MSSTPASATVSRYVRTRRSLVDLFASMRFAIALLTILAIASIIGTVIKQNDPYPNYVNQFGPFWADIFRTLDMYNVYSAWWFMLILAFLITSISLCVTRNGPKMIADTRNWKDKVREKSLRAFHHHDEYASAAAQRDAVTAFEQLLVRAGYKTKTREGEGVDAGATLISAKRGAFTRVGYILAHTAIVVICVGGLLDSGLMVRMQVWLFGKSPVVTNAPIAQIGPEHRLWPQNPSFRGYAWVPEGQYVSTAILNEKDGILLQDLPFSIQLNKFIVDYYTTGMPKLFASDIVVIDRQTGKRTPARVEVNKPFTYDGVSIYQSSFEDGGTTLELTGYPMTGTGTKSAAYTGTIGASTKLPDGDSVEFSDFRAINVENLAANGTSSKVDARSVTKQSGFEHALDQRLGSGAKSDGSQDLHNIGPSLQYKIRDSAGQAREFNNYMVPTMVNGAPMFLAGMRDEPDAPFRYLRIPADDESSVKQWMLLRAALQDPALRDAAARAFAQRSVGGDAGVTASNAQLADNLRQSASRVLNLFSGAQPDGTPLKAEPGQVSGGFPAVANFIEGSVPAADREKAAGLLLRMLEGSVWDLWQLAREKAGEPTLQATAPHTRFVQNSINALSDSFYYGGPVFLQLDNFHQIQASVFQLTRAPGESIVYLGSLLLVLGIFAMFYVRERRVWIWMRPAEGAGTQVLMAMSTARRTMDFEKEYVRMRDAVRQTVSPDATHAGTAPDATSHTPSDAQDDAPDTKTK